MGHSRGGSHGVGGAARNSPVREWLEAGYGDRLTFAVGCVMQVETKSLLHPPVNATRSHILKSVVLLLRAPLYGLVKPTLCAAARALFEQRDFSDLAVLGDLYWAARKCAELAPGVGGGWGGEEGEYVGTSLPHLLRRYRQKSLLLFKLLLLQRRVVFWSKSGDAEAACGDCLAVAGGIPGGSLESMQVGVASFLLANFNRLLCDVDLIPSLALPLSETLIGSSVVGPAYSRPAAA
ncbi:late secretory pathway protein avl9, partial [Gonapodya sp. JEL0774]